MSISSSSERLGGRTFITAGLRSEAESAPPYEKLLATSPQLPREDQSRAEPVRGAADGRDRFRYGWLLWLAIASAACLPPIGVSNLQAICVGGLFVVAWMAYNISLKSLVCSCIYLALEVFFREIGSRNTYKVPPEGSPVLFVCAPHANQFLDPFVVMMALGRQDIHFLTAAASMRKWYVRFVGETFGAIPVERPQDARRPGRCSARQFRDSSETAPSLRDTRDRPLSRSPGTPPPTPTPRCVTNHSLTVPPVPARSQRRGAPLARGRPHVARQRDALPLGAAAARPGGVGRPAGRCRRGAPTTRCDRHVEDTPRTRPRHVP